MAYCTNCGAELPERCDRFLPQCVDPSLAD